MKVEASIGLLLLRISVPPYHSTIAIGEMFIRDSRKMERFGDHCTNIAEELIFYLDAKVMKHIGKKEEK